MSEREALAALIYEVDHGDLAPLRVADAIISAGWSRSGQPGKNEGERAGLVGRDLLTSPSSPPEATS